MSDTVIIALIIAVVILAALIIFRKQLSKLFVKISKDSVEAGLETREAGGAAQAVGTPSPTAQPRPTAAGKRASVTISGTKQIGKGNVIDVGRSDVEVKDALQKGQDQQIKVQPDKGGNKPKP
ncbi:MAG: hypothetical protein FJ011_24800 [Chloroflexi bacterium]|nr:hypothetical protein [Chloroflexota bacterium]